MQSLAMSIGLMYVDVSAKLNESELCYYDVWVYYEWWLVDLMNDMHEPWIYEWKCEIPLPFAETWFLQLSLKHLWRDYIYFVGVAR